MRISDWSSDVCSSDLLDHVVDRVAGFDVAALAIDIDRDRRVGIGGQRQQARAEGLGELLIDRAVDQDRARLEQTFFERRHLACCGLGRSEEHTSELQSLMRISYAVFCLKNKLTEHSRCAPRTHALSGQNVT